MRLISSLLFAREEGRKFGLLLGQTFRPGRGDAPIVLPGPHGVFSAYLVYDRAGPGEQEYYQGWISRRMYYRLRTSRDRAAFLRGICKSACYTGGVSAENVVHLEKNLRLVVSSYINRNAEL